MHRLSDDAARRRVRAGGTETRAAVWGYGGFVEIEVMDSGTTWAAHVDRAPSGPSGREVVDPPGYGKRPVNPRSRPAATCEGRYTVA